MPARPFRLRPPVIPEQETHETCAKVFDRLIAPPATWAFYPAGAVQLPPAHAAKLSRMGLKRGWPDFIVLHGEIYGIELKRHGARLSKTREVRTPSGAPRILIGQVERFPELLAAGMRDIAVCYSVDDAVAALERWNIPLRATLARGAPAPTPFPISEAAG
jgi:hypothetical protein